MLKLIHPAHDYAFEEADQPAEQGSNSMDDVLNLAQVKAELSYLNRLEERREANVASLKRLKEARDALLGRGSEVAGGLDLTKTLGQPKLPRLQTTAGGGGASPVIASAAKQSTSPLAAPWIASRRSQ